jgi:hypothetical protein
MVRWLASWIGLADIDPTWPDMLQRNIVAGSAHTLAWRGTRAGLTAYLERITGGPVLVRDGGGVWREGEAPSGTAWVTMELATTGLLSEAALVELVSDEVPAHVDARLYLGTRLIWSSQEQAQ